jgi:hypothetical protein
MRFGMHLVLVSFLVFFKARCCQRHWIKDALFYFVTSTVLEPIIGRHGKCRMTYKDGRLPMQNTIPLLANAAVPAFPHFSAIFEAQQPITNYAVKNPTAFK